MKNLGLLNDVFAKTKALLKPCVVNEENDQASHILYYLSLFAGYLQGPEEAAEFKKRWLEIKADLQQISDYSDFMNQVRMLEDHIEQSLKSESVHNPKDARNPGIAFFYEDKFSSLYEQAKKAKEEFWERFNNFVTERQAYVKRLVDDDDFFDQEVKRDPNVWLLLD